MTKQEAFNRLLCGVYNCITYTQDTAKPKITRSTNPDLPILYNGAARDARSFNSAPNWDEVKDTEGKVPCT